jgi:hypothetical protein
VRGAFAGAATASAASIVASTATGYQSVAA